jgi:hypothetical protein
MKGTRIETSDAKPALLSPALLSLFSGWNPLGSLRAVPAEREAGRESKQSYVIGASFQGYEALSSPCLWCYRSRGYCLRVHYTTHRDSARRDTTHRDSARRTCPGLLHSRSDGPEHSRLHDTGSRHADNGSADFSCRILGPDRRNPGDHRRWTYRCETHPNDQRHLRYGRDSAGLWRL